MICGYAAGISGGESRLVVLPSDGAGGERGNYPVVDSDPQPASPALVGTRVAYGAINSTPADGDKDVTGIIPARL